MVNQILSSIEGTRVVAIVRKIYGDDLVHLAEALLEGGIRNIEVTFDQADPDGIRRTSEAIATLNTRFGGEMYAGAGTVVTHEQLIAASNSGACYIISPNTDVEIIRKTKNLGLVSIPGATTPTEIMTAYKAGADIVKLFPASELGTGYIKSIRAPLNHIKLMATGGVNELNFEDFIRAGCIGAGIGGNLADAALVAAGDFLEITRRARLYKLGSDI